MTTFHKSVMKGLREALAIERGEAIPQMQATMRNGVVLEIKVHGEVHFKLSDRLSEVASLMNDKIDSEAEFLAAYREVVQQTQEAMALLYGVNVSTYRNWEQGRRKPNNAVKRLMAMSVHEPEAFFRMAANGRDLEFA